MFVISFICFDGGSKTVIESSLQECKAVASRMTNAFPKSYKASTIPYTVIKMNEMYNVSVPFDIRKAMGLELRLLLLGEDV